MEKSKQPKVILNVSQGMLSVARHYGGCTYNGVEYSYIPPNDALLRSDLVKKYGKLRKEGKEFEEIIKEL